MVIGSWTQFTKDHFANWLRPMTAAHDALAVSGCLIDAFIAIPEYPKSNYENPKTCQISGSITSRLREC